MKVRIARTESFAGYGNVTIEVIERVTPGEDPQDAMERAAQEVASRLEFEARRREVRGKFWADHIIQKPLEAYAEGSGTEDRVPPAGAMMGGRR